MDEPKEVVAPVRLDQVFKTAGVPTHTFVKPKEWTRVVANLRTPGRGLVIEGPSGIGKTSAIETALAEHGTVDFTKLSPRRSADIEYIEALPETSGAGTVLIDDFHKLEAKSQRRIADYLKTLADEEREADKLIVVGINMAGENLIRFANDLVNRIDIVQMESNPDDKVDQLIRQGEAALNIEINVREDVVRAARGSFYLAQLLCHEVCVNQDLLEASCTTQATEISLESVQAAVWDRLGLSFKERCARFCRGAKFRPTGRAPYLHTLRWLAESNQWTLRLDDAIRSHREMTGSVGQVVSKGFLEDLINGDPEIRSVLHYNARGRQLTVEDPQFLFYIRNIPWRDFALELGFTSVSFDRRYDFALSFAGEDRAVARALADRLRAHEVEVFYDYYEQHRILAEDVEEYLRPIYQSEARFVIAMMGSTYPRKIWTKFESELFKERFGDHSVIPIWLGSGPSAVDDAQEVGGFFVAPDSELDAKLDEIAGLLLLKLREARGDAG